jgi:amino acid transporter
LLTQFVLGVVFIFLGQAGTSVKGAYDVLVSMGVITYFIPYLYLFAAMVKLQGEAAGPDVIRVPGGKPMARLVATVGFLTTTLTIVLSLIPQPDEPHKLLALFKIVGGCGALGRQAPSTDHVATDPLVRPARAKSSGSARSTVLRGRTIRIRASLRRTE